MTEEERRIQACIDYINTSTDIVMWVKIMAMKALGRMKEQKNTFHVIDKITGKEADLYEIALNEEWALGLIYCDMEGFAILENGLLILADECGNFRYCNNDRYEVVWDD